MPQGYHRDGEADVQEMEIMKLADKLEDQKKQNRAYVEVYPTPSAFDTGEQAGRTQLTASNSKPKNVNLSDTDLKRENEHS